MDVLIIEDEQQIAEIYAQILESGARTYDIAKSGTVALDYLSKIEYSLVLVDLMMPDMRGEELIDKFSRLENYENSNIVVLTNMGSGFDRDKLMKLGVQEIILKLDVGPDELLGLVEKYA